MYEEQITILFCAVDDFYISFQDEWHKSLIAKPCIRRRTPTLVPSEIMAIVIYFHQTGYRTFKQYYNLYVKNILRSCFPGLPSYGRFVELMKSVLFPLFCYLQSKLAKPTQVAIVDATALPVCHIKRASSHKTFRGMATKSKSSMGWFFGFKLHIVINHAGELLAWKLTKGNVDDRRPLDDITQGITGLLLGDRGYVSSKLFKTLYKRGLKLITRIRSNMKNKLLSLWEKRLLRKRGVIESVNNQLKNVLQIHHTRHRSIFNFCVNLMAGLIAYTFHTQKPSINFDDRDLMLLQQMS